MHFKKCFDPRFLGSWDFEDGKEMEVTIKEVKQEEVHDERKGDIQKYVVYFDEGKRGLVLSPVKGQQIADVTGEAHVEKWTGKKITLYGTNCKGKGGEMVPCIRVKTIEKQETKGGK